MKNKIQYRMSNIRNYTLIGFISALIFLFAGCKEDIGDNIYTFEGETIGEYLANRPETYSEFTKMLESSGVLGILKAYGKYTCFAPDNDAMYKLYELRGKSSADDFAQDTIKKIVYDHIIKNFEITSADFTDGFITHLTMSGRYIKVSFNTVDDKLVYYINSTSTISQKDIEAHNGIIHTLSDVLLPTENTLTEAIAGNSSYSLFLEALVETGLNTELEAIKDDSYDPGSMLEDYDNNYNGIGGIQRVPRERKYGFTAFMESNQIFAEYGIENLEQLKAYAKQHYDLMYPDDADISDPKNRSNSLNRFIAYHLINKKLSASLILEKYDNTGMDYESTGETHSVKSVDMFEYIGTMCPNTLIEVRTLRESNEYNVFNLIESGEAIRLTDDFDNDAVNGVYHGIDGILMYTTEVDRMLSSKRLRMDAASFFPELTNNNIRVGHATQDYVSEEWIFPRGYIDNVTTSPTSIFRYINADDRFMDYQGDEIILRDMYDFKITTLPIPAGTYEVRFGWQPTPHRGVAQLYWDSIPTGIPLNLTLKADDPKIGWEAPGTDPDDPDGFENDKMMRNRGYMKAPASFKVVDDANNGGWYLGPIARNSVSACRRILGIYTFDETTTHKFTVKAVKAGEFMFDYLEFVPIEVLEYEDIY